MTSVAVDTFATIEEAQVVRSLLVANDIPAILDCAYHAQNDWFIVHALGGIRVFIPGARLAEARDVIAGATEDALALSEVTLGQGISDDRNKRRLRRISLPLVFFGLPQAILLAVAFSLIATGIVRPVKPEPRLSGASEIRYYNHEAVPGPPLPPPAPPPSTAYHTDRSYVLPGLEQLLMFGLLCLAFGNFEIARRNRHDPPRHL